MGGLKKMISQFINNFKKTEFYTNRKLQVGILISSVILGSLMELSPPAIRDNLMTIMVYISVIFIPIGILAIYDDILED